MPKRLHQKIQARLMGMAKMHSADGANTGAVKTIPEMLAAAAAAWPARTALNFFAEGTRITFAEFRDQVLRVAAGLREFGVAPGDRIGILLANVMEFPVAWLAIIHLRAVAVPLNPKSTARELAFFVEDTGMVGLICAREQAEVAGEVCREHGIPQERCIVVDHGGSSPHSFSELLKSDLPNVAISDVPVTELVSIQFTSGTTGLPKGCMLTHEYWSLLGSTGVMLMGEQRPSSILGDHPFHYMQNQGYLINALIAGATMHVSRQLSLRRFVGWLHEFEIDFAWLGDALLSVPAESRDRGHRLRRAPADAIDPSLHRELEQRFGVVAREWYASTETGFGVVSPWDDVSAVGDGSIGFPAPYRETKLIDEKGGDLPIPASGELCVRGPGMMLGYWNRPEVNAELFLEGGWFRTGDLVRIDKDGRHFFIGRIKDTIRRSGENIAAAEVEQEVNRHPGVLECAAIPVPDPYRGEEVKVLVVRSDLTLNSEQLRRWCIDTLAPFKVPRYIAFRDELPRTPSGKIWKAKLKAESDDLRLGAYDFVDGVQR